ncbi:MAG: hypothetical protein JWQ43_864 [Glaciihabitans sp.]|nr:hypothetical protein [Glaciihabitans sp.]
MPLDDFPLVDVRDIIKLVGYTTFERGFEYAIDGAVDGLEWNVDDRMLSGNVFGSGSAPYLVDIDLSATAGDFWQLDDATCTCYLGYGCKHIAATLLCSDAMVLSEMESAGVNLHVVLQQAALLPKEPAMYRRSPGGTRAPVAGSPGGPDTATPTVRAKPVPKWKTTLVPPPPPAPKPGPAAFSAASSLTVETNVPMALQFEAREVVPRRRGKWRPPTQTVTLDTLEASAASKKAPVYRLAVRPLMRSTSTGNWVKGNLSWNSIVYQASRFGLNPDHSRWFAQFAALYTAGSPAAYSVDPDWFYLDAFESPLFWNLLEQAESLGIALVGSKKTVSVQIGGEVELSIDAATTAVAASKRTKPPLQLTSRLTINGRAQRTDHAGAIGDHGVYSFRIEAPAVYTIARVPAALSPEQRALLGRPAVVSVPGKDIDEFLTDYFPQLRRSIPINSGDGSVTLPEFVPPVLVLSAVFEPQHVLRLTWDWEYQQGGAVLRLPLRVGDNTVAGNGTGAGVGTHAGLDSVRDPELERATLGEVERLLATSTAVEAAPGSATERLSGASVLTGLKAAEFTARYLPELLDLDTVRVQISGEGPDYRERVQAPRLTLTSEAPAPRDWFDLGVLVSVDGKDIPFGPLFLALSSGEEQLLLEDNSFLSLDQPVFGDLKKLIDEASTVSEWKTNTPRISRYQVSLWGELEGLAEHTEQSESWRAAVGGLREIGSVEPTPLPPGVQASLRPYQQEGFDWLVFLHKHQLGGVLADDMGLGKTLQAIALIAHAVAERERTNASRPTREAVQALPFLVVAPTSVVSNWIAEAERFAPGLVSRPVTTTQATGGETLATVFAGADLVVTSYALFRLDFDRYQEQSWAGLILDEARFVKNPASIAHRCAVDLATPFKLAITGTPMENSLNDLWSLFSIVAPGLFPSGKTFINDYVKPIVNAADNAAELMDRLRRRIRPLMMRRTKELVAKDLPAKQEQVLRIDLSPQHKKLYDTYLQRERKKLLGLIDDLDKNRFMVFRSLTLLRMLSLDASLVDGKYAHIASSKLDALFEQLEDVVAEGHRALIFSQFTSFLKKAAERLDAEGIPYAYLDGSTLKRGDVIKRFKEGDAPVFLISLKAGGFGLNLTEADYVFLLDPWWNPATEAQAVDRTHRIGQTNNVMVYRMIATGTIEEKVMQLKEKKSKLFDAVMDDDAVFSSALTADDIRGLLD